MTVQAKNLVEGTQVPAAETALYTAPTSTRAILDKMTATNTTGTAATLTVHLITAAGSAGVSNAVISAQSIAAGATYLCPEVNGHILNPGDILSAISGTASAISIRVSGREVS